LSLRQQTARPETQHHMESPYQLVAVPEQNTMYVTQLQR